MLRLLLSKYILQIWQICDFWQMGPQRIVPKKFGLWTVRLNCSHFLCEQLDPSRNNWLLGRQKCLCLQMLEFWEPGRPKDRLLIVFIFQIQGKQYPWKLNKILCCFLSVLDIEAGSILLAIYFSPCDTLIRFCDKMAEMLKKKPVQNI